MSSSTRDSGQPTPPDTITMYGASWCPDCRRAKQFFGELRVHYNYIDVEHCPECIAEVERINHGNRSIPTILFPDGAILVEPSNEQLAAQLGLHIQAQRSFYDLIIIGSGPAGLTASIYASREGLSTLVIEKAGIGGQVGLTRHMENFPGFDEGISGADFAARLRRQAEKFGVEILQAQTVTGISADRDYRIVHTAGGQEYTARALIVATGSTYRRINVPGEGRLIGINIHFCATCDAPFYQDKEVFVLGGGNSGLQEALHICQYARHVTILEYAPQLNASPVLQEKIMDCDQIEVKVNQAVQEFLVSAERKLAGVRVLDRTTGEERVDHPDGVFILIGMVPNSQPFAGVLEMDQWGFITTSDNLETSLAGVFAAGDVRLGSTKQAAAAAGEGATGALMVRQYLQRRAPVGS